jgi:hypothetical protein
MMAVKGTLARMYVDQWDLSGETSDINVTNAIANQESTVLPSTAANFTALLPNSKLVQNGYINQVKTPGSFETELWNRLGVMGCYVAAVIGIDNPNCPCYVLDNTFGASMEIMAPIKGLLTLKGSWGEGNGGHRGYRVYDGIANATGPQAAADFVAAGANGGEAYLFVQAITGTATNATITVASSTTAGGTYTTLATFTISAAGSYKLTWAGVTNEFIRANVTSLGGATALDFALVVCVPGVTE